MLKPLIAATIGLSAMASVASADMIIVQSGPTHPADTVLSFDGSSERMAEMCARFGFVCELPDGTHAEAEADAPHPILAPGALADERKRQAQLYAELQETRSIPWGTAPWHINPDVIPGFRPAPMPVYPHPDNWPEQAFATPGAGSIWSEAFRALDNPARPRVTVPQGIPHGFGNLFPHVQPRIEIPHAFPRHAIPHVLPNLRPYTHPRTLPHGGLIPWPTL